MPAQRTLRQRLYSVVFETSTPAGNRFDLIIFGLIICSVAFVILESVDSLNARYSLLFDVLEWIFTLLFTIEYVLRIFAARNRWRYVTSFFGIVDVLAIAPTYLSLFMIGGPSLLIIRVLRLLRIFRIFQMGHFVREGAIVASALKASKVKIIIFLSFVLIASIFMGALMYMVEAEHNKAIENIPEGIYWAIVTLTTVGYGDAIPVTDMGKVLAAIVMVMGYAVIAVPTGIVTAEISNRVLGPHIASKIRCGQCGNEDHHENAEYCHHCGTALHAPEH